MTDEARALRFPGLDDLDAREFEDSVPAGDLSLEPQTPDGRQGTSYEPFTVIAVVMLTSAALKGIAAWLLKKRHRREVDLEVEEVHPDGTTRRVKLHFKLSESSSQAEVVEAISQQVAVDPAVLAEALKTVTG